MKVAIAITVFRNAARLSSLIDNMKWAGLPDIPVHIFEDPAPFPGCSEISSEYRSVVGHKLPRASFTTAPSWGCMQGIIQLAMERTTEDWIIYVPDDVVFARGGLWNELSGVLTYGRDFVGGIQAPYWNAHDLVMMSIMPNREAMYNGWLPEHVLQNPHWNYPGVPRAYINLNGAGFSLSRKAWKAWQPWPSVTWRLDEYAGYQNWKHGFVNITLPGPPRIHYFGGTTSLQPKGLQYHTKDAWKVATGVSTEEAGAEIARIMSKLEDGTWDGILEFFSEEGRLGA